jgi:tetratricopeptide (TPR) repeat protein
VHARDQRRPPLPARLTPAERDFFLELRRLVDTAGYSFRALEDVTSEDKDFFSKSQWGRWLNGQSLPPRRAVRKLIGQLAADDIDADSLMELWSCAFVPGTRTEEAASVSARPQELPTAAPSFTGRASELGFLARVAGRAADGQPGETLVIVIEGTAGIGKTTLAIHLAHQVKDQFPDGQLFVNLHGFDPVAGPVAAETVLPDFLESFDTGPTKMPASAAGCAALYRSLIARRRMLIVLDNARDPEHVRDLLPASPGCLILITSRNQMTGLVAEGAKTLRLDAFSLVEARQLFAERVGASRIEREADATEDLIGLTARLPLALSVAGAYVAAHPQFSLSEVASEFRDRRLDLLDTGDPATSVRSVFASSYQHLTDPTARLFRLLGIHPGEETSISAAASLAGLPVSDARKALTELARASLLTEPSPGRFAFHDLLRAFAAELAEEIDGAGEITAAEQRLVDHYLHSADNAVQRIYPATLPVTLSETSVAVRPEPLRSYEEAQSWLRTELRVLLATVTHAAARAPVFDIYCWQLPLLLATALVRSGRWHEYLACQRIALAAAERLGDPTALGHAHSGLAYACAMLGDTGAAREHLDQSLEAFETAGDQAALAAVRSRLAMLLEQQGRYTEALEHGREALRLRRAFGNRAAIAHAENVVGWTYARLGQHEEALRHCRRGLDLATETGSRSLAADILDSLGMINLAMGKLEQALSWYQQALAAYRDNEESRGVFSALTGIGDVHLATGEPAAARDAWRRALDVGNGLAPGLVEHVQARLARLEK